jgi:hypothetical protein
VCKCVGRRLGRAPREPAHGSLVVGEGYHQCPPLARSKHVCSGKGKGVNGDKSGGKSKEWTAHVL